MASTGDNISAAGEKRGILVLTYLYPSAREPGIGTFVEDINRALAREFRVVTVAPVSLLPPLGILAPLARFDFRESLRRLREWLAALAELPRFEERGGLPVYRPRYVCLPRQVLPPSAGRFLWLICGRLMRRLIREHKLNAVVAHGATPCGHSAARLAAEFGLPSVCYVHGYDVRYSLGRGGLSAEMIGGVLRDQSRIAVNSSRTRRMVERAGARPDSVFTAPLGWELPGIDEPRPPRERSEGPVKIVTVANLFKLKGYDYTLRALAELVKEGRDLRYRIVGDGPERGALEALVAELGLASRTVFSGQVPINEVAEPLLDADIFVMPSWDEAFGVVYLEALAAGLPIIGCKGQGVEDLFEHAECGILVEPHSAESVRDALARLIDEPETAARMAREGQEQVLPHYTWDGCARALSDALFNSGGRQ